MIDSQCKKYMARKRSSRVFQQVFTHMFSIPSDFFFFYEFPKFFGFFYKFWDECVTWLCMAAVAATHR